MIEKVLIGIDPDVDKSGYSCITKTKYEIDCGKPNTFETTVELKIFKLKSFEIFDALKTLRKFMLDFPETVKSKVYIEAGWLNTKSNWHVSGHGESVASRIGTKVGANHQVGKLIAEMCEYLGIEYELVRPSSSKTKAREFRMMTNYKGKLDQDMIDSAMLILGR